MVVNVARGDLVKDSALFADVNEGRVSGIGFGFDAYRNEPHIDERWLSLPNATLLPHIGSATQEVRTAMGMLALDGIESHFNGEPAANLLNPRAYG
jgi:lactate dehydrogenase-like 2-hydroxyacid dehydrogenase